MKVCIFDTETTGLPKNSKVPAWVEKDNWPHIVSLSWMILDIDTNKVVKTRSHIIYPHDWIIPEESTKIHRISHQDAVDNGYYLESVIDDFLNEQCAIYIAHNSVFDYNVLLNAIRWDIGRVQVKIDKVFRCSMEASRDMCKIQWIYRGYKSPKLSELYYYVFKKEPDQKQLHGSLYDVQLLTEIIQHNHEIRIKLGLHSNTSTTNNVGKARSTELVL